MNLNIMCFDISFAVIALAELYSSMACCDFQRTATNKLLCPFISSTHISTAVIHTWGILAYSPPRTNTNTITPGQHRLKNQFQHRAISGRITSTPTPALARQPYSHHCGDDLFADRYSEALRNIVACPASF